MISQRCPKCASSRVRRGYRPTPIWSKILFRYNLLCDACNWEFKGFAVPGTVSYKSGKSQKTRKEGNKSSNNIIKFRETEKNSQLEMPVANNSSYPKKVKSRQ